MERKASFIAALRNFAKTSGRDTPDGYGRTGFRPSRGTVPLVLGIAEYLDGPEIPGEESGLNWIADLPKHLDDAFTAFRTEARWSNLRAAYKDDTGHDVPDIVNVHVDGLHRLLVVHEIVRLMPILAESPWLSERLAVHLGAQQACIDQAWRAFVRVGYRDLLPRIKSEDHRGNRGEFGSTTLLTYAMAGRVMFTFSRGDESVTYVADDSDMYGCRAGMNVPSTDYATCVSMIGEVTAKWRTAAMVRSDSIGMW